MSDYKEATSRHLRHKLQSLGRRVEELEEASAKLQKSEDELLDLQDKILQAEGPSSALLGEVDALRRRVLKIEGKDEEVRKAEDLCRLVREKLVEEEELTKELKADIERLQSRMAELEKIEEAFGKSKSDCTQLCLSLNEEKNLTRKLSSELEALRARMKEVDASESRLDRAEQALAAEMERLKAMTQAFVAERNRLLEKQREDERTIRELREKLERNNQLNAAEQSRNTSNLQGGRMETGDLRIEDDLPPGLTAKLALRRKSLEFLDEVVEGLRQNKSEKEKKGVRDRKKEEEDNKVKDLTQEVERLKSRLKQLEMVEEDFKKTESKKDELQERYQLERNRSKALSEQMDQLKMQLGIGSGGGAGGKILENGKAENEEINVRGGFRQEKPKYRSGATESPGSKHKARELSPTLQRKEIKLRSKELSQSEENSPKLPRRALSPAHKSRRGVKAGVEVKERGKGALEEKMATSDSKKPSVLSRYPPAANDQKPWKTSAALTSTSLKPGEKSRVEKVSQLYGGSDTESNNSDMQAENPDKASSELIGVNLPETNQQIQDSLVSEGSLTKANGSYKAFKSHVSPHLTLADFGSEGHSSASETESTGSRRSAGETEPMNNQEGTESHSRPTTSSAKHTRYARLHESHSEGSSTRSSFDEERTQVPTDGGSSSEATPTHTPSGIEIRRVCSPREALRSKAVIKPAIVEIDRKEVMSSGGVAEPMAANGKPKISTKPVGLTSPKGKMTSSITIYPNDPGSSRTSSRSSSVCSEPPRERHTSTSNIVITSSDHHRNSVSIPYEISIPKSEIALRPPQEVENDEDEEDDDDPTSTETSRVENQLISRSCLTLQSPPETAKTPELSNDTESGFESSSSSSTITVTNWRSHRNQPSSSSSSSSRDDCLPDMRHVTVRSTWRTRGGAMSVDEAGLGRSKVTDGSEDESESSATTWRAYRATTVLDAEETVTATTVTATRTGKPSPAEVYMQRINSAASAREAHEPVRRTKSAISPSEGYDRSIPHEPVTAQELHPWNRPLPTALEETADPPLGSWRKRSSIDTGSYDRATKAETGGKRAGTRADLWAGQGGVTGRRSGGPSEGRAGGSRPWSSRQTEN